MFEAGYDIGYRDMDMDMKTFLHFITASLTPLTSNLRIDFKPHLISN